MKIKLNNLFKNSAILSIPGILSIFISLLSIPIHLNYAGPENYGNYIIFHFILLIVINLNLGIGKSTVISINNFPAKKKEISYKAINYTNKIAIILISIFLFIQLLTKFYTYELSKFYTFAYYLFLGSIITIFFVTFEGILQGNQKFKSISIFNLIFFSLSISVPSILLIFNKSLTLENLIFLSITIKFLSVLTMYLFIKRGGLIKNSNNKILLKNLKKNSKWITLNNILIQFYDLFDKYLIKIFIGPIAVASYSVPQQLTGKLSVISKSFSAFLLPNLAKKKIDKKNFILSLNFFIKTIPIIIFLFLPFYPQILKFWLGNSYNDIILNLTKIFTLSVIFSCASHILITKFEASKTLHRNLKAEFFLMPFFLLALFFLTSKNYSLLQISFLILFKELFLFFLRLYILKSEIKYLNHYYFYSIYFLVMLYFSFNNLSLFFILQILLIFNYLRK
tara:strand:- start:644 stop:1999 length:1356 start_codon:yes stop_codon:yes gene_type:complete